MRNDQNKLGMEAMDVPYKYKPLPIPITRYFATFTPGQPQRETRAPRTKYIRLATLEPATRPQDDLVIRLETVSFNFFSYGSDDDDLSPEARHATRSIWHSVHGDDPPPKYEALSYAWGSEAHPSRVRVRRTGRHQDDHRRYYLSVTRSLDGALRALRNYHPAAYDSEDSLASTLSRVLWIDAICIDQANVAEKGPQVAMMGSIFRFASRVVAWLGPEDETSRRAMDFMRDIGSQVNVSFRGAELSPASGAADPALGDMQVPLLGPHDGDVAECLLALLGRTWFSRLWVLQEILLADPARAVVLCGRDTVPWLTFRKAIAVVTWKWSRLECVQPAQLRHAEQVVLRLGTFATVQDDTAYLSRLRYDFGTLACKDPRDRIYAVLNLLGHAEREQLRIRPDYDKTVAEVYRDVVRRQICVLGDLTILEECEADLENGLSLPSWVPNWALQSDFRADRQVNSWATAQIGPSIGSDDISNDSSDVLKTAGVIVSTIQRVETEYRDETDVDGVIRIARMLFQEGVPEPDRPWDVPLSEWVRTFTAGDLAEAVCPVPQWAPSMKDGIETLRAIFGAATTGLGTSTSAKRTWQSKLDGRFFAKAAQRIRGRRMCKDSRGSLVLAPPLAHAGDLVCALLGSDAHVLLRPSSPNGGQQYRLIGTCFAHCALGEPVPHVLMP